jgi:hypothetical protein
VEHEHETALPGEPGGTQTVRPISAPDPERDRPTDGARPSTYKVVSVSLYRRDIEDLDAKVAELKRRGIARANKSWLIRLALSRLDLDAITKGDRP